MPQLNLSVNVSGNGITITQSSPVTCDGGDGREIALSPGVAGTLSTRTSDTAGVLTVPTGHGITTDDIIDVYFAGGVAYGCTVSATTSTTVTFTGASGDVLPIATTAIVVSPEVTINVAIDGDNVALIAINQKYADQTVMAVSHVTFNDVSAAEVAELDLPANVPQVYNIAGGSANPFSGNPIVQALASNASATAAATLQISLVQESAP